MNARANVVVVGAGPYGLSATVLLRRAGIAVDVFGDPMSFWRAMPKGMFLRSNWGATSIGEQHGPMSLDAFVNASGSAFDSPVPLEDFVRYGDWLQQTFVPDVDRRTVSRIERHGIAFVVQLDDGEELVANRVVVACGIARFAYRPEVFASLSPSLVSHTSDHSEFSQFESRKIVIVGGGQSALETAALAAEAGATVEVLIRASSVTWLRGHGVKKRIGPLGPVVYAPTDVGPLWYSRLVALPDVFRHVPRDAQTRIARRCIRPAGSHWLRERLSHVRLSLGHEVATASPHGDEVEVELKDGSRRVVDHVLLGTGFRVDLSKYPFLGESVLSGVKQVGGYPLLTRGLESSVAGLHFLGAPAAYSFGPIMRFVSGSWYASRALTGQIADDPIVRAAA